jgi:hypothetical protein
MPPDEPKSERLGLRLTPSQYAHLNALRDATGKSITALVNRALTLLTLDQIPDMLPPGEEVPAPLPDEVWSQLVIDALRLIEEAAAFNRNLIGARAAQEPVHKTALYRTIHRAADILNHLAKTLISLRNENSDETKTG